VEIPILKVLENNEEQLLADQLLCYKTTAGDALTGKVV